MRTDVLTLIAQTKGVDEYGDPTTTETTRQVFVELKSVGEQEFYQAHAVGLKPELKFVLADYLDYQDELYATYKGKRYKVLRTYRNGQQLEITCAKEVNHYVAPTPTPTPEPETEVDDDADPEISGEV